MNKIGPIQLLLLSSMLVLLLSIGVATDAPTAAPTTAPTEMPTFSPTMVPTSEPSSELISSSEPSMEPTQEMANNEWPTYVPTEETSAPTIESTNMNGPTPYPTDFGFPTFAPTEYDQWTEMPSIMPTEDGNFTWTEYPTFSPTEISNTSSEMPSILPTDEPNIWTDYPTFAPTEQSNFTWTDYPTFAPTEQSNFTWTDYPTFAPTEQSNFTWTEIPSIMPTEEPNSTWTEYPTLAPTVNWNTWTEMPSVAPTEDNSMPSEFPTNQTDDHYYDDDNYYGNGTYGDIPTSRPTVTPTVNTDDNYYYYNNYYDDDGNSTFTVIPTEMPTELPNYYYNSTENPIMLPTSRPTDLPTKSNSTADDDSYYYNNYYYYGNQTDIPVMLPTSVPTINIHTQFPTEESSPSFDPTFAPTEEPSPSPTSVPSTSRPSSIPTSHPTPTPTSIPTSRPTSYPTPIPTSSPTTHSPTSRPTSIPTARPTPIPTSRPTSHPSPVPTSRPTSYPTPIPTSHPTTPPPTSRPTSIPTSHPTPIPTSHPTPAPTSIPTSRPTSIPTSHPTPAPSSIPTSRPTSIPTPVPTSSPTSIPTSRPTSTPSVVPTAHPSAFPSARPSGKPTGQPTTQPTTQPTSQPTSQPTTQPTSHPSGQPSSHPTSLPTSQPTAQPSGQPSTQPSSQPTSQPSGQPSSQPTGQPTGQPSTQPSSQPTSQPSRQPTGQPSSKPTSIPTAFPTFGLNSTLLLLSIPPNITEISLGSLSLVNDLMTEVPIAIRVEYPKAYVYCNMFAQVNNSIHYVPKSLSEITGSSRTKYVYADKVSVSMVFSGLTPRTNYSVYCTTQAVLGQWMGYEPTIQNALVVETGCCKQAVVTLSSSFMYEGTALVGGLKVALDYIPAQTVKGTMSLVDGKTGASVSSSVMKIYPSEFTLTSTSASSFSASIISVSVSTSSVSEYMYNISLSLTGDSADEYNVLFSTIGNAIHVITVNQEPPTPKLSSSIFSSDGLYVSVYFDGSTNRAGYTAAFPCTTLFTFSGASVATCQWYDRTTVRIYPLTSSSPILVKGSDITLKSSTNLKAECTASNATFCSTWKALASATVYVDVPSALVSPTVSISSPTSLTACQSLLMDLSSSSGNSGRSWKSVSLSASYVGIPATAALTSSLATLNQFLITNYTYSPPKTVPQTLLAKGVTYAFTAKMCNFLDACGTTTKNVEVSVNETLIPVITIVGSSSRTISKSSSLSIKANAYTESCTGEISYSNLQYKWSIRLASGSSLALSSLSQNPATYSLPSYSLAVNTQYTVSVVVSSMTSNGFSSASISVYVKQGSIVASIKGGNSRQVRTGVVSTIDASATYDEDQSSVTGTATGLSFTWSCMQTYPTFSTGCSNTLTLGVDGSSVTSDKLYIQPSDDVNAINSTSRITLVVSDPSSSGTVRTSSAYVDVTVTTTEISSLNIVSSVRSLTSVPTNQRLSILATMQLISACQAKWSVDDSEVDLDKASLTSRSQFFLAGRNIPFNIRLDSNVLPQRSTLLFTLACGSTSTSVTVTTNGAPLPGTFVTSPSSGNEMKTIFSFTAAQWTDEDLPITYQFGFVSPSTLASMVLLGRSETSYTESTMPAGAATSDYVITCSLQVYDTYNASASASSTITVTELSASEQQSALTSLLSTGTDTVDGKKTLLSVASTVMNRINCTAAPNCTALHRSSCLRTENTCGECLSGYTGDSGDQNSLCADLSKISFTTSTGEGSGGKGSSCTADSDCTAYNPLLECSTTTNKCKFMSKKCSSPTCSGHGTCSYSVISTGNDVDECTVDDITCQASCDCDDDYSGSSCELSAEALKAKQEVRKQLVNTLMNLTKADDITSDTVVTWSSFLQSVSSNPYELGDSEKKNIQNIADTTIKGAKGLPVDYKNLEGVLSSVNSVSTSTTSKKQRRRLGESDTTNTGESVVAIANGFAELVASSKVYGEEPTEYLYGNFRMITSAISTSDGSSINISVPVSALESAVGSEQTSFSLSPALGDSDTSSTQFFATMIQTLQRSYTDGSTTADTSAGEFFSNPIRLILSTSSDSESTTSDLVNGNVLSEITFSIANSPTMQTMTFGPETQESFNLTCEAGDTTTVVEVACNYSTYVIHHECDGRAGTHVGFCPMVMPSCSKFDTSSLNVTAIDSCQVTEFTTERTVCTCTIGTANADAFQRMLIWNGDRELKQVASTNQVLDESGATDFAAASTYFVNDFADTFDAADELNSASGARRTAVFITLFSILWGGVILIIAGIYIHEVSVNRKRSKVYADVEEAPTLAEKTKKQIMQYVDCIMPIVYSSRHSLFLRSWKEISLHHPYIHLLTPNAKTNDLEERIMCAFEILSLIMLSIFVEVAMFDTQNPDDDGSCAYKLSRMTCLERKTPLDQDKSYCQWDASSGLCSFNENQFSEQAIVYVIIITTIVTSLFKIPLDFCLKVWASPVMDDVAEEEGKIVVKQTKKPLSAESTQGTGSALDRHIKRVHRANSLDQEKERDLHRTRKDNIVVKTLKSAGLIDNSKSGMMAMKMEREVPYTVHASQESTTTAFRQTAEESGLAANTSDPAADHKLNLAEGGGRTDNILDPVMEATTEVEHSEEVELEHLCKDIITRRSVMDSQLVPTMQYDIQWNLQLLLDPTHNQNAADANAHGLGITVNTTDPQEVCKSLIEHDKCSSAIDKNTQEVLKDSLGKVIDHVEENHEIFELYKPSVAGLELLHLFMIDLLGYQTKAAVIFRNKFNQDFARAKIVSKYLKIFCIALILGLNGFFMYFALLKGVTKGLAWQRQFVIAFIINLAIDVLLFETIECVWIHYVVPESVREEVQRAVLILEILAENVDLLLKPSKESMDYHGMNFDASSYFFISKRLAKLRPNLMESQIVLAYKNHFPGMIWKTWPHYHVAKKKSDKLKWFAGLESANIRRPTTAEGLGEESTSGRVRRHATEAVQATREATTWIGWMLFPIVNGIANGIVYVLQSLGVLPYIYQKVIVRVFQSAILSGVTLLWYWAMKHPAAFAAIVIIILLLVLLFTIKFCVNTKNLPGTGPSHEEQLAGQSHDEPVFTSANDAPNPGEGVSKDSLILQQSVFSTPLKRPGTSGGRPGTGGAGMRRGDSVKPFVEDLHQIINDHAAADIEVVSLSREPSRMTTPIRGSFSTQVLSL